MASLEESARRLVAASEALRDLGPAIAAGEPWPLADVYAPGPESAWGPREVLAHCAEFLPYWMGQIERILDGGPEDAPVPFGRTEQDPLRIQIIGRDRELPGRELLSRIGADATRVARRLGELSDADAGRQGLHPVRGPIKIQAIVDNYLVAHLEGHVEQLRASLDAPG